MTAIERVAVVGGGVMGNGIVQVVAAAGLDVTLVDVSADALAHAVRQIERRLERDVERGRMIAQDAEALRARIATTVELSDAVAADHVIETVTEELALKQRLLAELDGTCRDEVVFASNTSQFSISALASATGRPDRVIGTHWFNPPPVMRLIEVVRGVETSDATLDVALALAERYGKETVVCRRDTQGFLTSRLIIALAVEAMRILEEGVADAEDINRACVLAFNHAMGPLDTADLSGLDTVLKICDAMTEHYGDRYRAPQNIRALVSAGHYGRKSGRGFREY
jgi:3-hydroxybutyryl-CoA dehydrogenase